MNSRLIRAVIVVIGIAVVSAASFFLNDLSSQINSQRWSSDNLREQASALGATIAGVHAGQFAYVARGQNESFWMSHVAGLLPLLEKQTTDFAAALTSPAAQSAFEPAAAALENLKTLDSRVRDFVQGGTSLLAADMIFSDGLESTSTASTQLAAGPERRASGPSWRSGGLAEPSVCRGWRDSRRDASPDDRSRLDWCRAISATRGAGSGRRTAD